MARNADHKIRTKEYLLLHPTASDHEVMVAMNVSMKTVSNARHELVSLGKIPPSAYDRKTVKRTVRPAEAISKATEGTFDVKTTADLNAAVDEELRKRAEDITGIEGEVDIGKLKRVLWKVVHRNLDDRIVVAAASALARIQQEADARPLGPGKPLTKADAIDRLIMLFKACGVNLVVEALNTWIGKDTPNAQTEAAVASITPPAPAPTVGTPDNSFNIGGN